MNKTAKTAVFLACALVLAWAWYAVEQQKSPPVPQTPVFVSQEECESSTGQSCGFVMCDYIPPGKSFEETCGAGFREGWQPRSGL